MLPDDVMLHMLSFLPPSDLTPVSKDLLPLFRSDVLWRAFCESETSCFEEYVWRRRLEDYQFRYKRQWTLGCLGRLDPPQRQMNFLTYTKPSSCSSGSVVFS